MENTTRPSASDASLLQLEPAGSGMQVTCVTIVDGPTPADGVLAGSRPLSTESPA